MASQKFSLAVCIAAAVGIGLTCIAQDGFIPTTEDTSFYEREERSTSVTIHTDRVLNPVRDTLFGLNTSYFNDTDSIWGEHDIAAKLKRMGIGALRYPGGEETSFFRWEHPGVNGYEDPDDDPSTHGSARDRGPFQVTWVNPDQWGENTSFMSFDDYLARCVEIGAEPLVGVNLSAGRRHGDIEAGVEEALRMLRHAHASGHEVRYCFLDNEPWHGKAAYTFDIEKEYVADVLRYGRAIKAEFPNTKLIANSFSAESVYYRDYALRCIRAMGEVIDYIDMHWYWGWGLSSWERWLEPGPMTSRTKWMPENQEISYIDTSRYLHELFEEAGHEHLGLVVLEWNLGPSAAMLPLSDEAFALMHAQMLMEFAQAEVEISCLWPLIWRTRREVWAEQDKFPSVLGQDPPFTPTRSADVFDLLSEFGGAELVASSTDDADLRMLTARDDEGLLIAVINKSRLRRKIDLDIRGAEVESVAGRGFSIDRSEVFDIVTDSRDPRGASFYADRYSFAVLRVGVR